MTHPKTGEQELERLAEKYAEANEGDNHYSGFKAGYRAAQQETELLMKEVEEWKACAKGWMNSTEKAQKRIEKLENALEYIQLIDEKGYCTNVARAALSGDKASEGEV